jgi:hypothetical protein
MSTEQESAMENEELTTPAAQELGAVGTPAAPPTASTALVPIKTTELDEVGGRAAGPTSIILIIAYLVLFSILLLYSLVELWPLPTPARVPPPITSPVTFLFWTSSISDEVRLLLIVALAGTLGGLVHALRSLYWYIGNRELVLSWLAMYILLPFVGTTLGLVFYFVIRGGFFHRRPRSSKRAPLVSPLWPG